VFENEMRRKFEHKGEEVTGGWRKLCNREIDDFCSASDVIGVIKSRNTRWTRQIARMGTRKMHTKFSL
jgi:hypothetical protein